VFSKGGEVKRSILWAILAFLAQIPFVIAYSGEWIPIHPIVVILPLVGLLNGWVEKRGPEGLGLTLVRPGRSLLLGALYAALSFGGWLMGLHLEGWRVRPAGPTQSPAWLLLEALLVGVFIIALWEEVLNRGYIQTRLQKVWGFWGVIVTTLLFAAMHVPSVLVDYSGDWFKAVLTFASAGVTGFVLGYVYWRVGSVLTTIVIHGLNNFATGAFLLLAGVSTQEMLFRQPVAQLAWLVGQAGVLVVLARLLFEKAGRNHVPF
jgi:membrane protease YdiL (CAAX protease family)